MPIVEIVEKIEVPDFPPDELLIETDGVPLETDWHRIEIGLLVELVHEFLAGRNDYFAGGNMFLYFNEEQLRNRDYRGPDFFFVWGPSAMPLRRYWATWKEGGHYPDVIIELLSPSTAEMDRTVKKDLYEQTFRTPEYFLYDPDTKKLEGWHLGNGDYEALAPNEKGWLWSKQLQLWLGTWDGFYLDRDTTWLRFYTKQGILVPTFQESARGKVTEAAQQVALAEQKAVAAEQKAVTEANKAVSAERKVAAATKKIAAAEQKIAAAEQKIAEERRRAEEAEAELARLKALLEKTKD